MNDESKCEDRQAASATADAPHSSGPQPPALPIPNRLNVTLVFLVLLAGIALLWCGSRADNLLITLGVGVVFSYVMLTGYFLLHEAAHDNLHSRPWGNHFFGFLAGLLFPAPFSMVRVTHQNHHQRNRTDHEMFDLYYPTDNRLLKRLQWYCILCGLFWPLVPLGAILFSAFPRLLQIRMMREAPASLGMKIVDGVPAAVIRAIRVETILIAVIFAGLFWLLQLKWLPTLILYGCFSFNWSTRQYITHAFAPRDVIEGAWNLRHGWFMSRVLLFSNWDLNHHRRPDVPWLYLPQLSAPTEPRLGYVAQYWRQWRGPRPCAEPAPEQHES